MSVDVANPVSTIGSATDGMDSELLQIGAIGLGIGASLFALRKGWQVAKGFIR
ncbi:hypothetical protein [Thermomonospora catenispora]|uniref:hypothetical protein n=1 Tax=Thermomonospora catenispora TaxID=2493090 RepID=UPI00137585A2|nr:hypothetical protein [Thermomonospora catenispora]